MFSFNFLNEENNMKNIIFFYRNKCEKCRMVERADDATYVKKMSYKIITKKKLNLFIILSIRYSKKIRN